MHIDSIEKLDDLSDAEVWKVARNRRNVAEIRHAAIQRWLYPHEDEDELSEERMEQLALRATVLDDDEEDEYQFEDDGPEGAYFDAEGRLIVEHNGVRYLIDPPDAADTE